MIDNDRKTVQVTSRTTPLSRLTDIRPTPCTETARATAVYVMPILFIARETASSVLSTGEINAAFQPALEPERIVQGLQRPYVGIDPPPFQ